jgi:hypothetical protein
MYTCVLEVSILYQASKVSVHVYMCAWGIDIVPRAVMYTCVLGVSILYQASKVSGHVYMCARGIDIVPSQ